MIKACAPLVDGFDEKVKQTLDDLISVANFDTREVLSAYDPSKDRYENAEAISRADDHGISLDPIAKFLGIDVLYENGSRMFASDKDLAIRIVLEIQSLFPEICSECIEEYCNYFQAPTEPKLRCFLCLQGSHNCEILVDKVEKMPPKPDLPIGTVWLCYSCLIAYNPLKLQPPRTPSVSPASTIEPPPSLSPVFRTPSPTPTPSTSPSPSSESSESTATETSPAASPTPIPTPEPPPKKKKKKKKVEKEKCPHGFSVESCPDLKLRDLRMYQQRLVKIKYPKCPRARLFPGYDDESCIHGYWAPSCPDLRPKPPKYFRVKIEYPIPMQRKRGPPKTATGVITARTEFWGSQQMFSTFKLTARSGEPSDRLFSLSQPKRSKSSMDQAGVLWEYSCGRGSPLSRPTVPSMKSKGTSRLTELSEPKLPPLEYISNRDLFEFGCGRSTPIVEPLRVTKTAPKLSRRTMRLAEPKKAHVAYLPNRDIESMSRPSEAARTAKTSGRLEMLSRAKQRPPAPERDPEWKVAPKTLSSKASKRIEELSQYKKEVEGFQAPRAEQWKVKESAKKAQASPRISELSVPKKRESMTNLQYNPAVFKVSDAAKKAKCTTRLQQLALPVIRKFD